MTTVKLKETCVMCGADISGVGVKSTYTAALIFGNKSRDPHVGPYCKDCGPPAIARLDECVEDCPLTTEKWIPVDGNCITEHLKRYPLSTPGFEGVTREFPKCEFSLGRSPIRHGISCIHPTRMELKRNG